MQKAELTVEEVDKIFGPRDGPPEVAPSSAPRTSSASTPSSTSRRTATTRCPRTRSARPSRSPTFLEKMVARRACSATRAGSGFYKKAKGEGGEKEILALDLKTLEYRPQQKVRFDSLGAAKDIEDVARARSRTVLNGDGQGGEVRRAGHAGHAGLRQPPHPGDRRRPASTSTARMRWGFAWDLGPFETWDAYGVQKGVERMKELGLKPAPWVEEMLAAGRERFYGVEGSAGHRTGTSRRRRRRRSPENARTLRVEYLQRGNKKLDGQRQRHALGHGRRRAAARVPLEDELHRRRHHRDDEQGARRDREELPRPGHRQRRRELLRRREHHGAADGRQERRLRTACASWSPASSRRTSGCATARSRW